MTETIGKILKRAEESRKAGTGPDPIGKYLKSVKRDREESRKAGTGPDVIGKYLKSVERDREVVKKQAEQAARQAAGGSAFSTRGAGPSGDAKIHNVQYSSKKAAEEAARHSGSGKPIHHVTGSSSGHYHATNQDGGKLDMGQQGGVHHMYGSPVGKNDKGALAAMLRRL